MKTSSLWVMSLLTLLMFIIVDFIGGVALPVKPTGASFSLVWWWLPNALVAITVSLLAARAPWRGLRLALALAAVPLTIQVINVIEGVAYLKTDPAARLSLILSPLKYAMMVPLWLMIFRPAANLPSNETVIPTRTVGSKLWRIIFCDFLYVFLYLVAGALIYPFVRDFYATQPMPSLRLIVALQLILRGPLFTGIVVLLARMVGGPRFTTALFAGLAFAVLSGVAPLIAPNSFFPDAVRWVHLCEVTSSNFVFGIVVSWIWSKKKAAHHQVAVTA